MAPKTVASSQVLSCNWLNGKLPNGNTLHILRVIHLTYCSQTTESEVSCTYQVNLYIFHKEIQHFQNFHYQVFSPKTALVAMLGGWYP